MTSVVNRLCNTQLIVQCDQQVGGGYDDQADPGYDGNGNIPLHD